MGHGQGIKKMYIKKKKTKQEKGCTELPLKV